MRWHQLIHRRVYSVPGPNALWHIDGNHRLIRWRLVVHGAIDGFSRMIIYLHCSTDNTSETVYNLFIDAVQIYNYPSRVRSDKGVENHQVCTHMIQVRGTGRNSHIAGSSTHNQRIERSVIDTGFVVWGGCMDDMYTECPMCVRSSNFACICLGWGEK